MIRRPSLEMIPAAPPKNDQVLVRKNQTLTDAAKKGTYGVGVTKNPPVALCAPNVAK